MKNKVLLVGAIIISLLFGGLLGYNISNKFLNKTREKNEQREINNNEKQNGSINKLQILSLYKEKISTFSDSNHLYSVIDINNDNIPELLVFTRGKAGNEIIAFTDIYTYDEKKESINNDYIKEIGTLKGRLDFNTSLYKMNNGRLLAVYGYMGYETKTYYKIENNSLIETEFSSREVPIDEDYIKGDIEIIFKSCTDTSLIDNYK